MPRLRRYAAYKRFASGKTLDLTEFTSGRSSQITGSLRGSAAWGSKPGYEDRKAELEAKLNK